MTAPSRALSGTAFTVPTHAVSIDYDRFGTLPLGLVPDSLSRADLALWMGELSVSASFRGLARPAEDALDPEPPTAGSLAAVSSSNAALAGVTRVLVRRDLGAGGASAVTVDPAALAALGPSDAPSRAAAAALIPAISDEALVAHWWAAAGALPALPSAITGVLDSAGSAQASHLLTTDGTTRGELEPLLLRAVHPGTLRFERYQHLGLDAGATPVRIRASAAGRLVLQAAALAAGPSARPWFDDEATSPWRGALAVAYDNVEASSVAPLLAALIWDQLVHHDALRAVTRFTEDPALAAALTGSAGHVLQCWRGWLAAQVFAGGASADVTSMSADADRLVDVTRTPMPAAAVSAALTATLADTQLRGNLLAFVVGAYAPLCTGDATAEIFVDPAVVIGGGFAAARPPEQALLAALIAGPPPWVPVFAGAPIGRPALTYSVDGVMPATPEVLVRTGLVTHDLEALHLAGATAGLSGPPPAATATAIAAAEPLDLSGFAHLAVGHACVVRLIGARAAFTTRDWLHELTRGCTRNRYQPPLLDADLLAMVGHPVVDAVRWDLALAGRALRSQMDALADTRVTDAAGTSRTLASATANWWADNVELTDAGGNWPFLAFIGPGFQTKPPSSNHYARAGGVGISVSSTEDPPLAVVPLRHPAQTRPFLSVAGFDELDLEVAAAVCELVRNGADRTQFVELPLVLALLEREGYRVASAKRRGAEAEVRDLSAAHNCFRPGGAAVGSVPAEFQGRAAFGRQVARHIWAAQHYGMDRLVAERPASPVEIDSSRFVQASAETFIAMTAELTAADADGHRLLDPSVVSGGDLGRFIDDRIDNIFRGAASMTSDLRIGSPRLQLIGAALQQALFQWFHARLVAATGAADDYIQIAEFTAAAPPPPGATSQTLQRRDYLAYYAAVYLAYNTASGPGEWNFWLGRSDASRGAGTATRFLLFESDPSAMSNLRKGQVGHFTRFAHELDCYARLGSAAPEIDTLAPALRDGVW